MQVDVDGKSLAWKMELEPRLKNGGCDLEGGIFSNSGERIGRNYFLEADGRMKSPNDWALNSG